MAKKQGSRANPVQRIRQEPLFRQRIVPGKLEKARRDEKRAPVDLRPDLDD